eukprot:TRINITY_DN39580_c0_g1_i1.p1 TRINITY_DN39580_c0_g1~~TRINITY_DN39580_c0_g1_i1.p1  ORF type:complete len:235 (+),score=20.81 TRINITY_DN39580_c0_g1_i1:82-786(+)
MKERRCRAVAIEDFHSAVVHVAPSQRNIESPHLGSLLEYSSRVMRSQHTPNEINTHRAGWRAFRMQHASARHMPPMRQNAIDFEEEERLASLALQTKRNAKVVRFEDRVALEHFEQITTEQCELSSTHELCLVTFVHRVLHAHNFSHEFNEEEAITAALRLRGELKLQEHDPEDTNNAEREPWLLLDSSAARSRKSRKRIKKCFWELDTGCIPEQLGRRSDETRWQDLVRQAAG